MESSLGLRKEDNEQLVKGCETSPQQIQVKTSSANVVRAIKEQGGFLCLSHNAVKQMTLKLKRANNDSKYIHLWPAERGWSKLGTV